jgi:WXXGXW repeat (2 copies)
MRPITQLPLWALPVTLALAVGCASSPPLGPVYVVDRPPPFRVEVIPTRPGPAYLWVPGYWRRGPGEYVWVTGRYVIPPAHGRAWVPGQWRHNRRGWYFVEGHWR